VRALKEKHGFVEPEDDDGAAPEQMALVW